MCIHLPTICQPFAKVFPLGSALTTSPCDSRAGPAPEPSANPQGPHPPRPRRCPKARGGKINHEKRWINHQHSLSLDSLSLNSCKMVGKWWCVCVFNDSGCKMVGFTIIKYTPSTIIKITRMQAWWLQNGWIHYYSTHTHIIYLYIYIYKPGLDWMYHDLMGCLSDLIGLHDLMGSINGLI